MPTVDNLDIQISAQVTRANASLTTLINRLDKVSASLMGVNSRGMATMGAGVNKLTNSMQNFSNATKTADFSRLARNLSSIGSIDGERVKAAASGIQSFAGALGALNKIPVSDSSLKIAELAKGISQLGYKSSTNAITNIPKLATAMSQLMRELSKAPVVSRNLIDMTNALAKLARTGASSGRAAKSLGSSLDRYTLSTTRATKGTFSLASALGKLYATYWLLFRAFGKIGDAINIASDLYEVQNVVDVTFGNMASKVEEFAQTSIKQFGMSELTLKQVASQFQAMGAAMSIDKGSIANAQKYLNAQTNGYVELSDSMADVSLTLTKLTADMASFYNVEQSAVAEDLQSIFTGQTKPLRQYGVDLTEVNLKQWAMTQGLNSNIDAMTQAEKTMLRYQYVLAHTGAAQGDFARTSNSWANQVRILRQQFEQLGAVIGKTFIAALKPLINALNNAMSHIIAFAQTVSNALGKIFGWKFEVGGGGVTTDLETGADYADDLAGGMSDAAKSAKKLKSYLLGIDELNVIEPVEDASAGASGGGGTGGAGGGGATGGEWIKDDSILKGFESQFDTLYKLGEYIGKVLTDAMNNIEWGKIYEKARNFGKGLAEFLNGLISPELFSALGKTIANSLNTVLHTLDSFAETFDWTDFGLSIASGINSFFENFNFSLLARTINKWSLGLLDTIIVSLDNVKWSEIGSKISKFLRKIEWREIVSKAAEAFGKALKSALELTFSTLGLDTKRVSKLGDNLTDIFKNIAEGAVDALKTLQKMVTPIINAIIVPIDLLASALAKIDSSVWAGLFSGISSFGATFFVFDKFNSVFKSTTGIIAKASESLQLFTGGAATFAESVALNFPKLGALLANPFALATAAITGLSVGLIAIQDSWVTAQNELWKTEQIEKFGDTLDNIKDKYTEMSDQAIADSQARLNQVNSTGETEIGYLQYLAEKYEALSEKQSLSAQEYSDLQFYSQELVNAFPQLESMYNTETGLLETQIETIEELINVKEQELKLDAISENWKTALEEQIKLEQEYAAAVNQATNAKYQMREIEKDTDRYTEAEQEQYAKLAEEYETCTLAQQELAEALKATKEEASFYANTYAATQQKINETNQATNQAIVTNSSKAGTQAGTNLATNTKTSYENAIAGFVPSAGIVTDDGTAQAKGQEIASYTKEGVESTLTSDAGRTTTESYGAGMVEGIQNSLSQADFTEATNNLNTQLSTSFESLGTSTDESLENIKTSFKNNFTEISTWFNDEFMPEWFTNGISPWFSLEKWELLFANIETAFDNTWTSIKEWWNNTAVYRWYNDDVKTWFTEDKWTFSGIQDGLTASFESAITELKSIWNAFVAELNQKLKLETEAIEIEGKQIYAGGTITLGQIQGFANGGYVPTSYSMFMAGENGVPELLGTVGGRTAVAGGAEITGIREAVYDAGQAEVEAIQQQNALLNDILSAILNKELIIGDREVVESYDRGRSRMGYSF